MNGFLKWLSFIDDGKICENLVVIYNDVFSDLK